MKSDHVDSENEGYRRFAILHPFHQCECRTPKICIIHADHLDRPITMTDSAKAIARQGRKSDSGRLFSQERDSLADLTERERRIGEAARLVSRGYVRGREI